LRKRRDGNVERTFAQEGALKIGDVDLGADHTEGEQERPQDVEQVQAERLGQGAAWLRIEYESVSDQVFSNIQVGQPHC
jgi:hypothetical protein